jgi:peptidyl-prolyl cis-trans isomerase A (cyclophilin A)
MTRSIVGFVCALTLAVAGCGGPQQSAPPPTDTTGAPPAPPASAPAPTPPPAAETEKPAPPAETPAPSTEKPADAAPADTSKPSASKYGPGTYAHFTTTNGNFIVKLLDKDAPKTVANFVGLAEGKKAWTDPRSGRQVRRPYYRNVLFHRVTPNFMIQGGDPEGTGMGGPGYTFDDEISPNHRHNKPGIVSMANRGPNTNGGQFFITVAPYPSLDGKYSIFGEVVEGLDNVVAISKVPTSGPRGEPPNRPKKDVVVSNVRIERVS